MTPDCQGEAIISPSCTMLVRGGVLLAGQPTTLGGLIFKRNSRILRRREEEDSCILRRRRFMRRLRILYSENWRSDQLPGGSCPGGRRGKTVALGSGRVRDVRGRPDFVAFSCISCWKSTDILVHTLYSENKDVRRR